MKHQILRKITSKTIIRLITLLLIIPFNSKSQNLDSIVNIDKYVESIDSLYSSFITLKENAFKESEKLSLSITIFEGVFLGSKGVESNTEGGFDVKVFKRDSNNLIFRIQFEGGKRDSYVTKTFYYNNENLVYAFITVRKWNDDETNSFKKIEYYQNNKILKTKLENRMPKLVDNSLVVQSLFDDGTRYLREYNE